MKTKLFLEFIRNSRHFLYQSQAPSSLPDSGPGALVETDDLDDSNVAETRADYLRISQDIGFFDGQINKLEK